MKSNLVSNLTIWRSPMGVGWNIIPQIHVYGLPGCLIYMQELLLSNLWNMFHWISGLVWCRELAHHVHRFHSVSEESLNSWLEWQTTHCAVLTQVIFYSYLIQDGNPASMIIILTRVTTSLKKSLKSLNFRQVLETLEKSLNLLTMKHQWTYGPTLLPWFDHFHTSHACFTAL